MIKSNKWPSIFSSQPANQSTRKLFVIYLKALILLSPIPFGCVGKIWAPLFYLLLTILIYVGFRVKEIEDRRQKIEGKNIEVEKIRSSEVFLNLNLNLNLRARGTRGNILYEKWIKSLFVAFLVFVGLQIVPLPIALVKLISPKKIEVLIQLMDDLPVFTSLSMVPFETLIFGLIVVLYGLFFWMLNRIHLRKKEMVSIFNTLVLSASIQVIFGLFKLAQGNKMFFLLFYPIEKSAIRKFLTGTLGNANHFAFFLEMIIPVAMALFFYRLRFFETEISFKKRVLSLTDENKIVMIYFISIALMGIGIFLTGSRSGIVTMIFLFILFTQLSVYLKLSRDVRRKMTWILVAISGLVLYFGIHNTVNEFKRSPIAEGGRFTRWPNTVEMVKDYPLLGTGLGTYRYSYFLYDNEPGKWSTHAHNDLLEVLAEGGVVGSGLFFALIGLVIVSIIKKWLQRNHPDVKILGLGIMVSIFAVIFHSFFDFSLRIPSNMLVFVLVLVLGIKVVNYKSRST